MEKNSGKIGREIVVDHQEEIDAAKLIIDALKQIMTLDSASIVAIAAFFDKFPHQHVPWLVGWAFGCFAASLMMCVASFLENTAIAARKTVREKMVGSRISTGKVKSGQFTVAVWLFLSGMWCFALFAGFNVVF